MFKRSIDSEPVEIAAPIEVAWDLLVDLDRYHEWNPFARTYRKTDVRVGSTIHFDVKLDRYNRKQTERIAIVEPPTRLAWTTNVALGLVKALRVQRLEKRSETSCTYFNTDTLEGPLAPVARLLFGGAMHRGFAAVGRALKQAAEKQVPTTRTQSSPMRTFAPDENIQRGLVSTTSRVIGNYEDDGLAVALTFPGTDIRARLFEGSASRTSLVVSFSTPELDKEKTIIFPNYSPHLAAVAACMAVLFGKRFDVHGLTEEHGRFRTPDISPYVTLCDPQLSFNSHRPRKAFPVKLELQEFSAVSPLFSPDEDSETAARTLLTAATFYMRALQGAEREPEVAYLLLISAGEVLAGLYPKAALHERTQGHLSLIRKHVPDGGKVAKDMEHQLRGIRRSFVTTLTTLLDSDFFDSQDDPPFHNLNVEGIGKAIGSAYDLRSVYLHSGAPFGNAVTTGYPYSFIPGELKQGNRKLRKATKHAPTFVGMERVIRYAILRCMENHDLLGARSPMQGESSD